MLYMNFIKLSNIFFVNHYVGIAIVSTSTIFSFYFLLSYDIGIIRGIIINVTRVHEQHNYF